MFDLVDDISRNKKFNNFLSKAVDFDKLNALCKSYDMEYTVDFIEDDNYDGELSFLFVFTRDNGQTLYDEEFLTELIDMDCFESVTDEDYVNDDGSEYSEIQAYIFF